MVGSGCSFFHVAIALVLLILRFSQRCAIRLTQLETQNKITAIRNQCKELQEELETLAEEKERAESALEKLKAEVGDDGKKREG